jgi:hypothetical protein
MSLYSDSSSSNERGGRASPDGAGGAGTLSTLTGGSCLHYGRYAPSRDRTGFRAELAAALARPFAYDAVLRVRVSVGLRVRECYGHYHARGGDDLEIAGIDCEKGTHIHVCLSVHVYIYICVCVCVRVRDGVCA